MKSRAVLWIAQGFGSGRVPVSPGTAGSFVGLFWFIALIASNSPVLFAVGMLLSIPASVWICGEGEKILKQTDPGSIVFDEIIAIPICFIGWLWIIYARTSKWPGAEYFFTAPYWSTTAAIFILFRVFDIAKPWPVRQSQRLRGGLGVTTDDVLAALYVNAVTLVAYLIKPTLFVGAAAI